MPPFRELRRAHEADRVADVAPLVEALAAHLVGEPGPRHGLLERRQLRVHPHQHGDLGRRDARGNQPPRLGHERQQLGVVVAIRPDRRHGPGDRLVARAFDRPVAAMSRFASASTSGVER